MLPVEPQELKVMTSRYHEAVVTTNDVELISQGNAPAPSKDRKHVFDFHDGVRIIVSIDRIKSDVVLHVSASANEEYAGKFTGSLREFFGKFTEEVERRLVELRGCAVHSPEEVFVTNRGVLHLLFRGTDEQLRAATRSEHANPT